MAQSSFRDGELAGHARFSYSGVSIAATIRSSGDASKLQFPVPSAYDGSMRGPSFVRCLGVVAAVMALGASSACGGDLPPPPGAPSWAAGKPLYVDFADTRVEDLNDPAIAQGVLGHLKGELQRMGFTQAPSATGVPIVHVIMFDRSAIQADLRIGGRSVQAFLVDESGCTNKLWGRLVFDHNEECFARGLAGALAASAALRRAMGIGP